MKLIMKEELSVFYQEQELILGEKEGRLYLLSGGESFLLTDYPFEPCLYMKSFDGKLTTIRHAFTADELRHLAAAGGTMCLISGNEYDLRGICMLLRKAAELSMDSVDSSYLEGRCFIDYLQYHGARSPETAISPANAGIQNANVMNPLLHSKKVSRTSDGLFYLGKPSPEADKYSRVISNQVRFGYGFRTVSGQKQYYAWHGYPNRNDDYITTAEITENEFSQIGMEYPQEIIADRETAEVFRKKYVNGHKILCEGWNRIF